MGVLKEIYLIRHAKSSWSSPHLDDFDRPLNSRGKRDGPVMAKRLGTLGFTPEIILSSPAKRARKTARYVANEVGYKKKDIRYHEGLYLGSLSFHLQLLESVREQYATLFLVGHNYAVTQLAEYLTGRHLGNVPTAGVVGVSYDSTDRFTSAQGAGRLLFFDYPKNTTWSGYP